MYCFRFHFLVGCPLFHCFSRSLTSREHGCGYMRCPCERTIWKSQTQMCHFKKKSMTVVHQFRASIAQLLYQIQSSWPPIHPPTWSTASTYCVSHAKQNKNHNNFYPCFWIVFYLTSSTPMIKTDLYPLFPALFITFFIVLFSYHENLQNPWKLSGIVNTVSLLTTSYICPSIFLALDLDLNRFILTVWPWLLDLDPLTLTPWPWPRDLDPYNIAVGNKSFAHPPSPTP